MADTARVIEICSAKDYLARERANSHRHEYVDGALFAIAGASERHNLIAGNFSMLCLTTCLIGVGPSGTT